LLQRFEENMVHLEILIKRPLERLKELEELLKKNSYPVPNPTIDYGPAVLFIKTAKEKNISLHRLKEEIREANRTKSNKGFRFFN
jgi:hypothetical protein